jgi:hypothetical protein
MDVDSPPPPQSRPLKSYNFHVAQTRGFSVEEQIFYTFTLNILILFLRDLFFCCKTSLNKTPKPSSSDVLLFLFKTTFLKEMTKILVEV